MSTPINTEFDPENWSPVIHGPTWRRGTDGKFILPEHTLGYEAFKWTYANLKNPNGGPWKYSKEQARLILWWYAIDETGEFYFADSVIQRMKGWGKDPTLASLSAFEMLGDCRFSHWDAYGKPVAKPPNEPWIQLAAVSKSQTKNTMKLFPSLFTDKAKQKYGLKIGREQVLGLDGQAQIEAVTSSPATLEGGRPSFLVLNETHHWTAATDGIDMAFTGRDNATKVGGRVMAITNAFMPGENSVAETDRQGYDDHRSGKSPNPTLMYDSLEAPANAPLTEDVIPIVVSKIRGDSVWVPVEKIVSKILDSRTPMSRARRMYYNQIVTTEDRLIAAAELDPIADETLTLNEGDEISLGFDGGHTDDSSALVAIRHYDKAIFLIKLWERPDKVDDWEVPMDEVDDMVQHARTHYAVRAFFSDVHPIESWVIKWSDDFRETVLIKANATRSVVGFDMRGNGEILTRMNEALVAEIRNATVRWTGDVSLRTHFLNAVARSNRWGITFGKESRESKKKVDAYAASLLAFTAMSKYIESGKKPPAPVKRRGWLM